MYTKQFSTIEMCLMLFKIINNFFFKQVLSSFHERYFVT